VVVLGFPCNQFGHQEPGTADEIGSFCEKNGVTFPLFEKIDVNGKNAHPLFQHLKSEAPGFWHTGD
jgi:glutathione peroxidase